MDSWRDAILNEFVPGVSKLTLVADPDSLLAEEKLALELRQRGFDLIEFKDPVEFRYVYESKYRSLWDRGEYTDLVVILRLQDTELTSLPYDLLQAGRKLSFNLGKLFPNLSYPVVQKLDLNLLDSLFDAQRILPPDRLGDNATKDLILSQVFGITAEQINNEVELLSTLLRLHYGKIQVPHELVDRLVQVLRRQYAFHSWPLGEIVPDDKAFFAFLQERWPVFLNSLGKAEQIGEGSREHKLKYGGPDLLPFDHQKIRIYIDNLFVEGILVPVQAANLTVDVSSWIRYGVVEDDADDDEVRISRLFELIEQKLPTVESRHDDWTDFALKWAELSALIHYGSSSTHRSQWREIGDALNETFATWLREHYASLITLPPIRPSMGHHLARRLAREMEDSDEKRVALIVVDGLSLDQWVTVRWVLNGQSSDFVMRESATFAWIPTLTSVSRQAIFFGKPPQFFPASINSTDSEEKLWQQFWTDNGLSRPEIAYKRGLGSGDVSKDLDETVNPGQTKAVGLVVDMVDKIMHGMQLGAVGMHGQVTQWCQDGYLGKLIDYLLGHDYDVWLTSDHGNIECEGKGRPTEGVLVEIRSARARVYQTPEFRSQVASAFTSAREWEPVGLPDNYFPLVAGGRDAFVNPGNSIVGHGGITLEEVIVPLVRFERRTR